MGLPNGIKKTSAGQDRGFGGCGSDQGGGLLFKALDSIKVFLVKLEYLPVNGYAAC